MGKWIQRILARMPSAVIGYVAIKMLFLTAPTKLLEHAVVGWADDQIAEHFGLSAPTVQAVARGMWEWGVPLALLLLAFYLYHLAHTRWGPAPVYVGTKVDVRAEVVRAAPPNEYLPDVRLVDVVKRIRGKENIFGPDNSESMEVLNALAALREKALNKNIIIWGRTNWRRTRPGDYERLPRQPIPGDFWKDHQIDYMAFTSDQRGVTSFVGIDAPGDDYFDLWFDKEQIDKIWPPHHQVRGLEALVRDTHGGTQIRLESFPVSERRQDDGLLLIVYLHKVLKDEAEVAVSLAHSELETSLSSAANSPLPLGERISGGLIATFQKPPKDYGLDYVERGYLDLAKMKQGGVYRLTGEGEARAAQLARDLLPRL